MNLILLILVILILAGGIPPGQPWHGYGYYPSGGVGLVLLILLILIIFGRL